MCIEWDHHIYCQVIPQNCGVPFCKSTFTSNFLIGFLNVTPKEINATPLCILCTLMSQIIPLLTLTFVRTWYEESTPMDVPQMNELDGINVGHESDSINQTKAT
jgi:hypothetical protein